MYYIVEFLSGEGGVSAVPKAWFKNNEAFWPPFSNPTRFINAFKKCESPGAGWVAHKCRVLGYARELFILHTVLSSLFDRLATIHCIDLPSQTVTIDRLLKL